MSAFVLFFGPSLMVFLGGMFGDVALTITGVILLFIAVSVVVGNGRG